MYDGFEYWFAEWDLENNLWSINPLIDGDVLLDTDGDSFDCYWETETSLLKKIFQLKGMGIRTWGKYSERNTVRKKFLSFGDDAINAYIEEMGYTYFQATNTLYNDFISKSTDSATAWKNQLIR